MAEPITVEEILELNPHVGKDQLRQSRELLAALRWSGSKGAGYNLASPSGRRRAVVGEEASKDPRTIRLDRRQ